MTLTKGHRHHEAVENSKKLSSLMQALLQDSSDTKLVEELLLVLLALSSGSDENGSVSDSFQLVVAPDGEVIALDDVVEKLFLHISSTCKYESKSFKPSAICAVIWMIDYNSGMNLHDDELKNDQAMMIPLQLS